MVLQLVLSIVGLALLYFGAEWLVEGSSRLALRFGISPLVIGLTVVAFGTSSPELLVCLQANMTKPPLEGGAFVLGNILGSNIYNIALILAIGALIRPINISRQIIVREVPILIGAVLLLIWFLQDQRLSRTEGGIFFAGLLAFLLFSGITSAKQMREKRDAAKEEKSEAEESPVWKSIFLIVAGLGALIFGSNLLVESATRLATLLGVSPALISLTLVAFGTSVPELATVVVASMKNQGDIITGNVIGSNIFNVLAILGITALVRPVVYSTQDVHALELYYMAGITILLLPLLMTRRWLSRGEGMLLLASCMVYLYFLYQQHAPGKQASQNNSGPTSAARLAEPALIF